MMTAGPPVTIVILGRRVDASIGARIDRGVVFAPLDPFVRAFAERIEPDDHPGRVTIVRGARRISLAFDSDSPRDRATLVPIAQVARALGACVDYDARTRTLAIWITPEPVATFTPEPHDAPPPVPLATFTPKATSPPAPVVTGVPRPRRTPIEVGPGPDGRTARGVNRFDAGPRG